MLGDLLGFLRIFGFDLLLSLDFYDLIRVGIYGNGARSVRNIQSRAVSSFYLSVECKGVYIPSLGRICSCQADYFLQAFNFFFSNSRPRKILALTVPTGIPRMPAISW